MYFPFKSTSSFTSINMLTNGRGGLQHIIETDRQTLTCALPPVSHGSYLHHREYSQLYPLQFLWDLHWADVLKQQVIEDKKSQYFCDFTPSPPWMFLEMRQHLGYPTCQTHSKTTYLDLMIKWILLSQGRATQQWGKNLLASIKRTSFLHWLLICIEI